MDYAEAGVDIEAEEAFVNALKAVVGGTRSGSGETLEAPGGYAGLYETGETLTALSMDGVGTKILVAEATESFDTVGIDCVAMNVNDVACTGIEPVLFADYLAVDHHDPETAEALGEGLAEGCRRADVELIAGETATLPEMVHGLDLVGTCIGVGTRDHLADGEAEPGDRLVGLRSSGIHSNGLTLARRAAENSDLEYQDDFDGSTLGETLLEPTEIYVEATLSALRTGAARAAAHVTGGGMLNLERMGENHYCISSPQEPQPVFDFVREEADVEPAEMYRTYNMGTGMVLATDQPGLAIEVAEEAGHEASVIGRVEEGEGVHVEGVGEL